MQINLNSDVVIIQVGLYMPWNLLMFVFVLFSTFVKIDSSLLVNCAL